MDNERVSVKWYPVGPSRTEQAHRGAVNINQIVAKYHRTRLLPQRGDAAFYGDFTNVTDYHSACDKVLAAQQAFMTLPSKIRDRFNNDPAQLLDFLGNEANRNEAIKIGIIPNPVDVANKTPEPGAPAGAQ